MNIKEVQVTMTDWAIPLIPRPQIGYSGEHAVCEFEVLTLPEEGFTYYLEVKEKKKEPNTILLTAESDRLTIELTSEMLGAAGIKKAQVVAYGSENDETPIKKSNIFEIEVKDSINATKKVESHYQTALEQLTALINSKQDKLIAGENITIENNVISSTGGGMDYTHLGKLIVGEEDE